MFAKTSAIVLRVSPFSRTSHMVTWLDAAGRQLVTVVKGATRPKSIFLGQYDLFYTCELLSYENESDTGVRYAKECYPERLRANLRANWRASQCASWFALLAREVTLHSAPMPELYALLTETLDCISASPSQPPSPLVFARYESKLLAFCGLRPNFAPCSRCASRASAASAAEKDASTANPKFDFNLSAGMRHCGGHSERHASDAVISITEGMAALFNECARSTSLGSQSPLLRKQTSDTTLLLRFLGLFIRLHIDTVPISGRAIALAALSEAR